MKIFTDNYKKILSSENLMEEFAKHPVSFVTSFTKIASEIKIKFENSISVLDNLLNVSRLKYNKSELNLNNCSLKFKGHINKDFPYSFNDISGLNSNKNKLLEIAEKNNMMTEKSPGHSRNWSMANHSTTSLFQLSPEKIYT